METLERIIGTGHSDPLIVNDERLWAWAKNNLPILEMTAHEVSDAMREKAKEQAPNVELTGGASAPSSDRRERG